jgi:tetratricopeptide (TPR) repeat protein
MRTCFYILIVCLLLCVNLLFGVGARPAQEGREAVHNRQGLSYFDEALYDRVPKGQQKEADRAFDLAAAEFRSAIAAKPDFVEAHRNLARLHYVRKQFAEAAASYRTVTLLDPKDIDAYVLTALACTQLELWKEALVQLEIAKTQTVDRETIRKLDGYIQKIRERQ